MSVSKKVKSDDFSLMNQLSCKSTLIFEKCQKMWYFCLMLQRIQTVWMGIAVLGSVFLLLTAQDVDIAGSNFPVTIASVLLAVTGFLSILSYKQRKRQLMLNQIGIFINVLLIGVLIYWLLNLSGGISIPEKGIELLFPVISVVSLFIASHYIKRDEKLVKSVDRLR